MESAQRQHDVASTTPHKGKLLGHSLLGIVLGIGGGWLVLWLFVPTSTQPPSKIPSVPHMRPNPHLPSPGALPPRRPKLSPTTSKTLAHLSSEALYARCQKEAKQGHFGPTFRWLHKNKRTFPLWHHLYWMLAEGAYAAGQWENAAISYKNLAQQPTYAWSKSMLLYRSARALYAKKHYKKALQALELAQQASRLPQRKKGWLWWQQERREQAKRLWLHARLVSRKKKAQLYRTLWVQYPDSSHAIQAEHHWWGLWLRGFVRLGTSELLNMASLYLHTYHYPIKARRMLNQIKKSTLSRRKAIRYYTLWSTYYLYKKNWRAYRKSLQKWRKKLPKRKQAALYRTIALFDLHQARMRSFRRSVRSLRRRSRSTYARVMLQKGLYEAAKGRTRKAKSAWKNAWKASRNRLVRSKIYFYRALLQMKKRRNARRAQREFRQALQQLRRASRTQKRTLPVHWSSYWQARILEQKGRKKRSIRTYKQIAAQAPFSLYGLLATQRLQRSGQVSPLPFVSNQHPSVRWKRPRNTQGHILHTLARKGPSSLYAMELEGWAMLQRKPSKALRIHIVEQASKNKQQKHSILWLHQIRKVFTSSHKGLSRSLLMAAYPAPKQHWPKHMKSAEKYQLDTRLVASLLLHLKGFSPQSRHTIYKGPTKPLLWGPQALTPPVRTFDEACQRLRALFHTYKDVELVLEALLTRRFRYVSNLKKNFPAHIRDLRIPFLSPETQRIVQTFWIYQLLYLQ